MAVNTVEPVAAVENGPLLFGAPSNLPRVTLSARIYEHAIFEAGLTQPLDMGSELALIENGEFVYTEFWHDLTGRAEFSAAGHWSQLGERIQLCAESSTNPYLWPIDTPVIAVDEGERITFEKGGSLRLKAEGRG